jgi:uncharacterized membrane protein
MPLEPTGVGSTTNPGPATGAVVRDGAGFRLRGLQMTRIETFTDAAFAFALTLLVVSLEPPADFPTLHALLRSVPAFLLSATMLMMFWSGHHQWSRRYGLDDAATIVLSCVLVFTVLVYVYPLRFMFGAMMAWLGGLAGFGFDGPVTITQPEEVNRLFVIYGTGFFAMSVSLVLLYAHAWRRRDHLGLDGHERHETRAAIGAWTILAVTGLVSTLVALLAPPTMAGLPGWVYAPLGVIMPVYGRVMRARP